MNFVITFLVILAGLFAAAFFTKRRFGVLGLALSAGAMLSNLWVSDLTPIVANAGIVLIKPPLESVVSSLVILLPALLLLSGGPTYKTMRQRVIGAGAFAVLAAALLLEPLGSALMIQDAGKSIYTSFVDYKTVIITAGLLLALLDLLLTKTPKLSKEH